MSARSAALASARVISYSGVAPRAMRSARIAATLGSSGTAASGRDRDDAVPAQQEPVAAGGFAGQREVGEPLEQPGERESSLQSGQCGAEAEVGAAAEAQVADVAA